MRVLITGDTSVLIGNAIRRILKDTDLDIVVSDGLSDKFIVCCGDPFLESLDVKFDLSRDLEKWQSKGKRKMPKMI